MRPGLVAANVDLNQRLPWLVQIDPLPTADAQSGFDVVDQSSAASTIHNATKSSGGLSTDAIEWNVVLAAGTWTLECVTTYASSQGIATYSLDGVVLGTVDHYTAGATTFNSRDSLALVQPTPRVSRLRLASPTKNAAATGYTLKATHLELRRTA